MPRQTAYQNIYNTTTMDHFGQTVSNEIVDFAPRRDTIEHVANILAKHGNTSHRSAVRHNGIVIFYAVDWEIYSRLIHSIAEPFGGHYSLCYAPNLQRNKRYLKPLKHIRAAASASCTTHTRRRTWRARIWRRWLKLASEICFLQVFNLLTTMMTTSIVLLSSACTLCSEDTLRTFGRIDRD